MVAVSLILCIYFHSFCLCTDFFLPLGSHYVHNFVFSLFTFAYIISLSIYAILSIIPLLPTKYNVCNLLSHVTVPSFFKVKLGHLNGFRFFNITSNAPLHINFFCEFDYIL